MTDLDCEHVLREIELFLDHELDAEEAGHIQEHLTECGGCLQRKEFRATLRELVAKKCGSERAPEDLVRRIRDLLASEQPSS
jgi:mycothiol system anti-sigma-R factor